MGGLYGKGLIKETAGIDVMAQARRNNRFLVQCRTPDFKGEMPAY
jgi:hypothetical protein